jgi:hypothetical protein
MNAPLTFDVIVAVAFSAAIVIGTLAGFTKLVLMLLALSAPFLVRALIVMTHGADPFSSLPPSSQQFAAVLIGAASLALILSVIWLVPGPGSIVARLIGVLFAGCLVTLAAGAGSLVASQVHPGLQEELRTKSLTGPAALAVGNALMPLLPDNPDYFPRRERPEL